MALALCNSWNHVWQFHVHTRKDLLMLSALEALLRARKPTEK